MIATINYKGSEICIDLSKPLDISIPLSDDEENPIAWYLEKPVIEPVKMGDWIGKVSKGSSTNFNNILFNPHGHGTHTECLGHITKDFYSINDALKQFVFIAALITITPEQKGADLLITKSQIENKLNGRAPEAVILRTLPNSKDKKSKKYSNSNPPYLDASAAEYLRDIGIKHLLIDLPSVDKEKDDGKLLSHKAFWNVKDIIKLNSDARHDATITELIYVPDTIADGNYILNLQIASFVNDASPSKPLLYAIQ